MLTNDNHQNDDPQKFIAPGDEEEILAAGLQPSPGSSICPLSAEVAADFLALAGYWNRIIVRDMTSDKFLHLPNVWISDRA